MGGNLQEAGEKESMSGQITWKSKVGFGLYRDATLLELKITNPQYLKWAYENRLHEKYETIGFIFDNIKQHEFDEIMRGK